MASLCLAEVNDWLPPSQKRVFHRGPDSQVFFQLCGWSRGQKGGGLVAGRTGVMQYTRRSKLATTFQPCEVYLGLAETSQSWLHRGRSWWPVLPGSAFLQAFIRGPWGPQHAGEGWELPSWLREWLSSETKARLLTSPLQLALCRLSEKWRLIESANEQKK